jgi:molecular chaperone DnaK (HSP70)
MSLDYSSLLTADQKRNLLQGRIQQFASEAYQYTLNLKTAEELGSEDQLESIKKSIEILDAAIKVHQEELSKLPLPEAE